MKNPKLIVALLFLAMIATYFVLDLNQYLNLDYLQSRQTELASWKQNYPIQSALIYFISYIVITSLSLPGAAILTLIGGAQFGLLLGLVLVSFASTIGATLAFLISRYLLRDYVQNRFGNHLQSINEGIKKDGMFYLFTLRLVPIFPFFLINMAMGLTPIKTWQFFWVSQVGMLAGTAVYVFAGLQLGQLDSLQGIMSPPLLLTLTLLGLFPFITKKLLSALKTQHLLRQYPKPKHFDYDLIVIGAGAAGLVSAYIGSAVKAKVALIEKHKMGGDCLNTGCVPSKALLKSAKAIHDMQQAERYGLKKPSVEFEFADIMARVQQTIQQIEPHDSVERYTKLGVHCLEGEAFIQTPYQVSVKEQILTTRKIIIATGAKPAVPAIPGIENSGYVTSDTLWQLTKRPERMIIVGGGPIGCELSQAFVRLGSQVTLIEMSQRLLAREDPDVSDFVTQILSTEGVNIKVSHTLRECRYQDGKRLLICDQGQQNLELEYDTLLIAVGRKANTDGFGLQELGITTRPNGTLEVNEYLQTRIPNIYACGDVTGPFQFTHSAAHQAWYAVVNGLFGVFKRFKVDYRVIPHATFIDPEVARVGLNEQEAQQQSIPYEVTRYDISDLDRAITETAAQGWVKVLTVPGKDTILGATIVGAHAGELITEYVSAMKHNLGLNKILGTIHIYPTFAEANKYAAGEWKRRHAPLQTLSRLEKYFAWLRRNKRC